MPVVGFKKPSGEPRKRYSSDPKTRAAELVAEGKLGGRREGAGRPRKHSEPQSVRATSVIADGIRENADLAARVVPDVLRDPEASDRVKMAAIKLGLRIESADEDRRREDEREGRSRAHDIDPDADRDELAAALATKLANNPMLARSLGAVLSRIGESALDPPNKS
jgi:hypothetical protein